MTTFKNKISKDKMKETRFWRISVGGGYGSFIFEGSEEQAELMRRHKAVWEGAVARKRPATDEEIKTAKKIIKP
jgi:hypothetical protein